MKGKTHDLSHDLTFSAHTINCMCHSIRSMFRVLGIYNFDFKPNTSALPNPTPAFNDRIDQNTNFANLPSTIWLLGGYICIT